jgi:hypothetical protein
MKRFCDFSQLGFSGDLVFTGNTCVMVPALLVGARKLKEER